jgi:hypothetical protein
MPDHVLHLRILEGAVCERGRAAEQILQGYVRLNSSSDGIARALSELQSAAEDLTHCSRQFSKTLSDLLAQLPNTSSGEEEMEQ